MKKIIAALLLLCMLAVCVAGFTSCGATVLEAESLPILFAWEAGKGAVESNFLAESDRALWSVLAASAKEGSLSFSLESRTLLGAGNRLEGALCNSSADRRHALSLRLFKGGAAQKASLYLDPEYLALEDGGLLTQSGTLALYKEELEKLGSTVFGGELPFAARTAVTAVISANSLTEIERAEVGIALNTLLRCFEPAARYAAVKDASGKEARCVELLFTVNNENVLSAIEALYSLEKELAPIGTSMNNLVEYITGSPAEGDWHSKVEALYTKAEGFLRDRALFYQLTLAVNRRTGALAALSFSGDITEEKRERQGEIELSLGIAPGEIAFKLKQSDLLCELSLSRKEVGGVVTYSGKYAKSTAEGKKEHTLGSEYEVKSGALSLRLCSEATDGDGTEKTEVRIRGTLLAERRSAVFELESLALADVTLRPTATLTFAAKSDLPAFPKPSEMQSVTDMPLTEFLSLFEKMKDIFQIEFK